MKWGELRQALKNVPALVWCYNTLRLAVGALLLLCIQVVRPLVRLRIGLLMDERIGHLASNTEYLLRKEYVARPPTEKYILLSTSKPAISRVFGSGAAKGGSAGEETGAGPKAGPGVSRSS